MNRAGNSIKCTFGSCSTGQESGSIVMAPSSQISNRRPKRAAGLSRHGNDSDLFDIEDEEEDIDSDYEDGLQFRNEVPKK